MSRPVVWILNLDCERELAEPSSYRPLSRMAPFTDRVEQLWRAAGRDQDRFIGAQELGAAAVTQPKVPLSARLRSGPPRVRCWCPTGWARAWVKRCGMEPPDAPAMPILRALQDLAFVRSLAPNLDGARWMRRLDQLPLDSRDHPGEWLLRRRYGYAGRERLRLRFDGPISPAWMRWIERSMDMGGLWLEPWVARERDFSQHAYLSEEGALEVGRPCVQEVDSRGQWRSTRPADEHDFELHERATLGESVTRVADALRESGYFGPFGIDAFRWRTLGGEVRFHPITDLNLRLTMGWPVGMAGLDPDFPQPTKKER